MVTLKNIAEKCSVSITTVSNILNGKSNVSESTKARVLEVIKKTGYKPNYMARGLRAAKTNTLGIIIDDLTEFSSPHIIDGIMSFCEEKNYKAILENLRFYSKWGTKWYHNEGYKTSVQQAIEEFASIKVDGIIYVAGHARNITCIPENLEIPLTIAYAFTDNPLISSVEFDDEKASCILVNSLIKKGHNKIAIIAGKNENIHTLRRLNGFKKALAENGISFDEKMIQFGQWDSKSGYTAAEELYKLKKSGKIDFTAIFCFNDLMAAGLYDYLNDNNIEPGKDLSIAGFDNRLLSQYLKPALTTVDIPLYDIGRKSAELILKQINDADHFEPQQYFVDCRIIERNSVGKA